MLIVESLEQVADGDVLTRDLQMGLQIAERPEDEAPVPEAGVGKGELGSRADRLSPEQEIDVERSRGVACRGPPPCLELEGLAEGEQGRGVVSGSAHHYSIEEVGLLVDRDRLAAVEMRDLNLVEIGREDS